MNVTLDEHELGLVLNWYFAACDAQQIDDDDIALADRLREHD